jgi:tetratricopeptide (TPR) repeat protein
MMFDPRSPMRDAWRWAHRPVRRAGAALLWVLLLLPGCNAPMQTPTRELAAGDYDAALQRVEEEITHDRSERRYMLSRMRAGVLALDAGRPAVSEQFFAEVYDVLRTQGINADKTVSAVVLTEGVKLWKGEPFEQAMALAYYGMVQARLGSWDNARAAAGNALFYLRNFENDRDRAAGRRIDTEAIMLRSIEYENRQAGRPVGAGDARGADAYLDHGYVTEESNFAFAYLLHAIASQQMGRDLEAADYFQRVVQLEPAMRPTVDRLKARGYNTVLVVAYGLGPRKDRYGMDGALSEFVPRTRSDGAALSVSTPLGATSYPRVTDVNAMARDHRWNNLEDVRRAKSILGSVLLVGGGITLGEGIQNHSEAAVWTGAALLASGLYMKATAAANTDYCDVFPQRLYVVPLMIDDPSQRVDLSIAGRPGVVSVTGWPAADGPEARLVYVRLPELTAGTRVHTLGE